VGCQEVRLSAVAGNLLHAPPERDRGRRLVAGLRHVVEAERIRLQLLRARERPHDAGLGGAGGERQIGLIA
jgi:hypothetical protein